MGKNYLLLTRSWCSLLPVRGRGPGGISNLGCEVALSMSSLFRFQAKVINISGPRATGSHCRADIHAKSGPASAQAAAADPGPR
jgi:hypothetical protein